MTGWDDPRSDPMSDIEEFMSQKSGNRLLDSGMDGLIKDQTIDLVRYVEEAMNRPVSRKPRPSEFDQQPGETKLSCGCFARPWDGGWRITGAAAICPDHHGWHEILPRLGTMWEP